MTLLKYVDGLLDHGPGATEIGMTRSLAAEPARGERAVIARWSASGVICPSTPTCCEQART
jgi:hypothetical protein